MRAFSPRTGHFATVFVDISQRKRGEKARSLLVSGVRTLAARLAAAKEAERQCLARELHGRVGQGSPRSA